MRSMLAQLMLGFLFICHASAQAPPGYYDAANGLSGTALQAALHGIIDDHIQVPYSSLFTWFQTTDIKPDSTVWDMYSDVPGGTPPYVYYYNAGDECGNYSGEGDCYNREHSWPKSWFGGEVYPMYSDLFILYPTDGYVNNRRDNYPYGEVGTATWTSQNGSKLGNSSWPGYSGVVFEPIDEYKGDFARTFFYVSVRYYQEDAGWPGSPETSGAQLVPWALEMMLSWNSEDPVSQKETDRNNAVYAVQNNRNPFIDHPEYVGLIWGFPAGIGNRIRENSRLAISPNPVHGSCKVTLPGGKNNDPMSATIFTVDGRQAMTASSRGGNGFTLDCSGLRTGTYLIVVRNDSDDSVYHVMFLKL